MDRESLKTAVQTVAEGKFPLVVFPEGIITRSNDRLVHLMEGPAFIARAAAKQQKEKKVIVHPVFIRYFFEGDLKKAVVPVVEEIEKRLSWQPQTSLPLIERIRKIGGGLLALKEIEYFKSPQAGSLAERLDRLEDHLLVPLEIQWCAGRHDGDMISRIKRLRSAILPEMVAGAITPAERATCWGHLADLYLVQQLHCYPRDYLEEATPERILETIERYEEDLTDAARPHFPMRAVIVVGDAIEVNPVRDRTQEADPLMADIHAQLEGLMQSSKSHRRIIPSSTLLS